MFNYVQTFFVDPDAVAQAPQVLIPSVDLYFKAKPDPLVNGSGLTNPGVVVQLCAVKNETPDVTTLLGSPARIEYNQISAMTDASAITTFAFPTPVAVSSNTFYGIAIQFDDNAYALWTNKTGDRLVGTNNPSPGATGSRDGSLFTVTSTALKASTSEDLKFAVGVAKYTANTIDATFVNKSYEFLSISNRTSLFNGGEIVFANTTPISGSVVVSNGVVTGTNTDFTVLSGNNPVVFKNGNSYSFGTIAGITNSTSMVLNETISFSGQIIAGPAATVVNGDYVANRLYLGNSSANATSKFAPGQLLRGVSSNTTAIITSVDNITIDQYLSHINVQSHSATSSTTGIELAYSNGSVFIADSSESPLVNGSTQSVGMVQKTILSRSNEVAQNYLHDDNRSAEITVTLTSNNAFISPVMDNTEADIVIKQNAISNVYTYTVNSVVYDSEVSGPYLAQTRHLTTKLTFDQDRQAEDLKLYITAYQPVGTQVRAYAKVYNSSDPESFDDKIWTPLSIVDNAGVYSSSTDSTDYVEYGYSLPIPEALQTIPGSFTTTANSAVLTGVGTPDLTQITASGKTVRLYNALFPSNYTVAQVSSVGTGNITLTAPIANNGVVGTGMVVETVKYPYVAFNDPFNDNLASYYNASGGVFARYNTIQVKVLLLADNSNIVPTVSNIEVLGVSA